MIRGFAAICFTVSTVSLTGCGGGGGDASSPPTSPPAVTFSFPVVPSAGPPRGCVREDGKPGISGVSFHVARLDGGATVHDQVILPCDSPTGRRVIRGEPGRFVEAIYFDASGALVATMKDSGPQAPFALLYMPAGSAQTIELAARTGPYAPEVLLGIFSDRVVYLGRNGAMAALLSVTISSSPTRIVLAETAGSLSAHRLSASGRIFFTVTLSDPTRTVEYLSVRPDGTERLSLRTVTLPPNGTLAITPLITLRDREFVYFERITPEPLSRFQQSIRMLRIDMPGSDVQLAAETVPDQVQPVPGTLDRFVYIGTVSGRGSVLFEVNAERGNISIKDLTIGPQPNVQLLGFSQGRLYFSVADISSTADVRWIGEGAATARTVLTGLQRVYFVTDQAIVYDRPAPFATPPGKSYARADLDGSNERLSSVPAYLGSSPIRAGEQIFFTPGSDIDLRVIAFDLVTGTVTTVYATGPQGGLTVFRVGGRLVLSPNLAVVPIRRWIDSFNFDGSDRQRLDDGAEHYVFGVHPF